MNIVSEKSQKNKQNPKSSTRQNKSEQPNDFINGLTITAVMIIVITGILYGLYWMP